MQAPRLPSIFKHNGARAFDYKPVYYNPEKERIEKLKQKYATKELRQAEESIRERMQTEWRGQRQKSVGRSNTMLLAIIVGLFFFVYWVLMY